MRRLLLLLLTALATLPARAACNPDEQPSATVPASIVFVKLAREDCIGDPAVDRDELTQKVRAPLPADATGEVLVAAAQASIDLLAARAKAEAQAAGEPLRVQWAVVSDALARSRADAAALSGDDGVALAAAADRVIGDGWRQYLRRPELPLVLQGTAVAPKCQTAGAPCDDFAGRVRLWRVIVLTAAVHAQLQDPAAKLQLRGLAIKQQRWQAYRENSQHQYWWELALNGALMSRDRDVCPRAADGSLRGLCRVPTTQWILLHPDVGLKWSDRASASSELKPAFVVEVLGYHRIGWAREDTDAGASVEQAATIASRRGLSLAATYMSTSNGNRWSWGPMVHWDGWNLAVTKGPGERWGLVLNLQLADRLFERKADWTQYLKQAGNGSLKDLILQR